MVRLVIYLVIAAAAAFVTVDSPVSSVKALFEDAPPEEDAFQTRQAVAGLVVAIQRDARRQNRRVAVLVDDWLYCYPSTREVFLVRSGYVTDFASIPKAAQWAVNPFGNHTEAAVIHDWLYAVGEQGARKKADEIFRHAMMEQDVNWLRRNMMFQSVRLGGAEAYGRDDEWNFKHPRNFFGVPNPPFEKPNSAVIDVIDCRRLEAETIRLLQQHSTDWSAQ